MQPVPPELLPFIGPGDLRGDDGRLPQAGVQASRAAASEFILHRRERPALGAAVGRERCGTRRVSQQRGVRQGARVEAPGHLVP